MLCDAIVIRALRHAISHQCVIASIESHGPDRHLELRPPYQYTLYIASAGAMFRAMSIVAAESGTAVTWGAPLETRILRTSSESLCETCEQSAACGSAQPRAYRPRGDVAEWLKAAVC